MTLIILEGPDFTGKTTLAGRLCESAGYVLVPTPRKPGPANAHKKFSPADFDAYLLSLADDQYNTFVLDRHTPSNYAYGFMRGEEPAKLRQYLAEWLLFKEQAGDGLITIWFNRSPRLIADDYILLNLEQDRLVCEAYLYLQKLSGPVVATINADAYLPKQG